MRLVCKNNYKRNEKYYRTIMMKVYKKKIRSS